MTTLDTKQANASSKIAILLIADHTERLDGPNNTRDLEGLRAENIGFATVADQLRRRTIGLCDQEDVVVQTCTAMEAELRARKLSETCRTVLVCASGRETTPALALAAASQDTIHGAILIDPDVPTAARTTPALFSGLAVFSAVGLMMTGFGRPSRGNGQQTEIELETVNQPVFIVSTRSKSGSGYACIQELQSRLGGLVEFAGNHHIGATAEDQSAASDVAERIITFTQQLSNRIARQARLAKSRQGLKSVKAA
ncbi:MAG: hypothetical protein AAFV45_05440 [Pseudomonadota bacterium]